MSLEYLSGIGRNKSKAPVKPAEQKRAERVQKTLKREEKIKKLLVNTPQARVLKAVAKQSPIAAQKIQKAAVQAQQKRAFKKANKAAVIKQAELEAAAKAEEAYNIPIESTPEFQEGTNEIDAPEFNDGETGEENEIGIIYPASIGDKVKRKAKKAGKQALKTGKQGAKVANKRGKANVKQARAVNIKSGNRGAGVKSALTKGSELLEKYLNRGQSAPEAPAPAPAPEKKDNTMLYAGLGVAAVLGLLAFKK